MTREGLLHCEENPALTLLIQAIYEIFTKFK